MGEDGGAVALDMLVESNAGAGVGHDRRKRIRHGEPLHFAIETGLGADGAGILRRSGFWHDDLAPPFRRCLSPGNMENRAVCVLPLDSWSGGAPVPRPRVCLCFGAFSSTANWSAWTGNES